jgi:hypothetical protein
MICDILLTFPCSPLTISPFVSLFSCVSLCLFFYSGIVSLPCWIQTQFFQQMNKLSGNPLANLAALGLGGLTGTGGGGSMNASGTLASFTP